MTTTRKNPTNKRKHAIALRYEEGGRTPQVIASGAGVLAERIVARAKEHNVPVTENVELAAVLAQLPQGAEIPAETYRAVAEILAFLFRTDQAWREKKLKENRNFARLQGPAPR